MYVVPLPVDSTSMPGPGPGRDGVQRASVRVISVSHHIILFTILIDRYSMRFNSIHVNISSWIFTLVDIHILKERKMTEEGEWGEGYDDVEVESINMCSC